MEWGRSLCKEVNTNLATFKLDEAEQTGVTGLREMEMAHNSSRSLFTMSSNYAAEGKKCSQAAGKQQMLKYSAEDALCPWKSQVVE